MNIIKKIPYKYLEYPIAVVLIALMIATPVAHYLALAVPLTNSVIAYSIYAVGAVLLLLILLTSVNENMEHQWRLVDTLVTIMFVLGILSLMSSVHVFTSLLGTGGRDEGLLMLSSYYLIFMASKLLKSNGVKSFVVHAFIFFGIIHSLYGISQYFNWFTPFVIDRYETMVSGVAGNPNFMGSYIVLLIGLTAGLFYYSHKIYQRLIYLMITLLFIGTMFLTKAMSAMFGTGIIAIFFFVYIFVTRKSKRPIKKTIFSSLNMMIVGLVLILIAAVAFNSMTNGYLLNELINMYNEVVTITSTGQVNESFGSGRFIIWVNASTLIPRYFLFGSGMDTFGIAYHSVFPLSQGVFFDKVHNEYLQIAITQGIPALLTQLAIYGTVIFVAIKRFIAMYYNESLDGKYENMYFGLFLAVMGYLFQAFFNISVIDVAPFFWMILGLLIGNQNRVRRIKKLQKPMWVITKEGPKEIFETVTYDE